MVTNTNITNNQPISFSLIFTSSFVAYNKQAATCRHIKDCKENNSEPEDDSIVDDTVNFEKILNTELYKRISIL